MKNKFFECLSADQLVELDCEEKNFFIKMKNKYEVDMNVQHTEKQVFDDTAAQIDKLKAHFWAIEEQRNTLIVYFGSLEDYMASAHGRSLEVNISKVQDDLIKQLESLQDNFYYHYGELIKMVHRRA